MGKGKRERNKERNAAKAEQKLLNEMSLGTMPLKSRHIQPAFLARNERPYEIQLPAYLALRRLQEGTCDVMALLQLNERLSLGRAIAYRNFENDTAEQIHDAIRTLINRADTFDALATDMFLSPNEVEEIEYSLNIIDEIIPRISPSEFTTCSYFNFKTSIAHDGALAFNLVDWETFKKNERW